MNRLRLGGFLLLLTAGCSAGIPDDSPPAGCSPGSTVGCGCIDGTLGVQQCLADGSYGACACGGPASSTDPSAGLPAASDGSGGGAEASGTVTPLPDDATASIPDDTTPELPDDPVPPQADEPAPPPPPPPGDPDDPFAALREICVDHINAYRATVDLPPLAPASPEQQRCSDAGAEHDATTGGAHASAGSCPGLGPQNTCPGFSTSRGGDEGALIRCLDQMWVEGEPPISRQACISDRTGCFLEHGHYIIMTSSTSTLVACGFYRMPDGGLWMNQDFGS